MEFYFAKKVNLSIEEATSRVTEILKTKGFGIITEIDITNTFKQKINVDFRKYRILGACNPVFANNALNINDKVGLFLPCNVVIQDMDGETEVSIIDPKAMMISFSEPELASLAEDAASKLRSVIEEL